MMKQAIAAAVLAAGLSTSIAAVEASTVSAAMPVCKDSNGSKPGGSVYLYYGSGSYCDVVPPQRLHLLRTPSRAACDDAAGNYDTATRICWDVDY